MITFEDPTWGGCIHTQWSMWGLWRAGCYPPWVESSGGLWDPEAQQIGSCPAWWCVDLICPDTIQQSCQVPIRTEPQLLELLMQDSQWAPQWECLDLDLVKMKLWLTAFPFHSTCTGEERSWGLFQPASALGHISWHFAGQHKKTKGFLF